MRRWGRRWRGIRSKVPCRSFAGLDPGPGDPTSDESGSRAGPPGPGGRRWIPDDATPRPGGGRAGPRRRPAAESSHAERARSSHSSPQSVHRPEPHYMGVPPGVNTKCGSWAAASGWSQRSGTRLGGGAAGRDRPIGRRPEAPSRRWPSRVHARSRVRVCASGRALHPTSTSSTRTTSWGRGGTSGCRSGSRSGTGGESCGSPHRAR